MMPRLRASLRDIADDVRARPGRAGLSFLAIAVGMTALTVLLAVLGGLQDRARQIVQELGVNVLAVVQQKPEVPNPDQPRLGDRHVDLLAANLPPPHVGAASPPAGVLVARQRLTLSSPMALACF